MIVIEWLIEILFFACCGWVGYIVVKILTFGKVEIDYGRSAESVIAEFIGCGFLLVVSLLVAFWWT